MADTRTISDEETTLDQLTEKATAAASDLLLTRDAANEDYKIKAETLAEYIASGSIAAGEKKAVNGATLKTALDGKQAAGNYQPAGDYVTETSLETTLNNYETSEHAAETYATINSLSNFTGNGVEILESNENNFWNNSKLKCFANAQWGVATTNFPFSYGIYLTLPCVDNEWFTVLGCNVNDANLAIGTGQKSTRHISWRNL